MRHPFAQAWAPRRKQRGFSTRASKITTSMEGWGGAGWVFLRCVLTPRVMAYLEKILYFEGFRGMLPWRFDSITPVRMLGWLSLCAPLLQVYLHGVRMPRVMACRRGEYPVLWGAFGARFCGGFDSVSHVRMHGISRPILSVVPYAAGGCTACRPHGYGPRVVANLRHA